MKMLTARRSPMRELRAVIKAFAMHTIARSARELSNV